MGYAGARVGRPGGDALVGGLDDEVAGDVPDRDRRGRTQVDDAALVAGGRAPAPAGVGVERRAHGDPLRLVVVPRGRAYGAPRVHRRDRRVGAERERHPGALHRGQRVHPERALDAEALRVEVVGAAPPRVEGRLHARGDAVRREQLHLLGVDHLEVLEAVAGLDECLLADDLGRAEEPLDGLVCRGVADHVEAGLDAGARAGHDVPGDLLGGEVERAPGRRVVGVRRPHGRGARADRSVDAEVARRTGAAQRERLVDAVERSPVADHLGQPRLRLTDLADPGEVLRRRVTGGAVLVDHADAAGRRLVQRPGDGVLVGRVRQQPEHRLTGDDVGLAADQPLRRPAVGIDQAWHPVDERRRDHCGVGVDSGQVGRAALHGPVDLLACGRAVLRPAGLVPVETQHDRRVGRAGVRGEGVERLEQRRRAGEVHAAGGDPGLRQVHVAVHERRRHQPALELDDPVGGVDDVRGRVVVTGPHDVAVLDADGGRVRAGAVGAGGVHVAAAQQDSHGAIVRYSRRSKRPRTPSCSRSSDSA